MFASLDQRQVDAPLRVAGRVMECRKHGAAEHRLGRAGGGPARWQCVACAGEESVRRVRKTHRILVTAAGGRCASCDSPRGPLDLRFLRRDLDGPVILEPSAIAGGDSLVDAFAQARECALVCSPCAAKIRAGVLPAPPVRSGWGAGIQAAAA